MKHLQMLFIFFLLFVLNVSTKLQAQQDTLSYFPLGLWGIYPDESKPPFNPSYFTDLQWIQERSNWGGINGNYLVACTPSWVEDTIMTQIEPLGYKMDIYRHSNPDTSLRAWIEDTLVCLQRNNR